MNTEKELQLLAENARLRAQIELLIGGQVERIVREVLAQAGNFTPHDAGHDSENPSQENVRYGSDEAFEEWQVSPEVKGRVRNPSINRQGRPRAPMMPGEVAVPAGKFRKVPGSNPGLEDHPDDPSHKRRPPDLEKNYGESVMTRFQQGILLGAMGGLVLLVIAILGVVGWLRDDPVRKAPKAELVEVKEEPEKNWTGPQPREVADRFLTANYQEERLRWVRKPEAVAGVMQTFYETGAGATEKVAKVQEMPAAGNEGGVFARFVVSMSDGSRRLLCVPFDEGGGRVDFEAYVRQCSHPWSEILDGRVLEEAEVRVFLERNAYYNHAFSDEDQWLSLMASSPELEEPVFVYAKRGDPELLGLLENPPQGPVRYTVVIKSLNNSHLKRQFVISRVLCEGWVEP